MNRSGKRLLKNPRPTFFKNGFADRPLTENLGNMFGEYFVHRPCPRKRFQKAYYSIFWMCTWTFSSLSEKGEGSRYNSREPNLAVHQFPSDTLAHPLLSRNRYGKRLLKHPRPTVFSTCFFAHWPLTENVGKMFAVFRPTCQDSETQTCHRRLFFCGRGRRHCFPFC